MQQENGEMSEWKWYDYNEDKLLEDPTTVPIPDYPHWCLLSANCLAKNGYLGCVWIIKHGDGFYLDAASELTGGQWKLPDPNYFASVAEAVAKAQELWRPA